MTTLHAVCDLIHLDPCASFCPCELLYTLFPLLPIIKD